MIFKKSERNKDDKRMDTELTKNLNKIKTEKLDLGENFTIPKVGSL